MTTFHLLTGEYPPQQGGVGDYTCLLAGELAARGFDVHVWCPTGKGAEPRGVHLHRLPDSFGPASRRVLKTAFAAAPGCVLLQYVPNALGGRGANVAFCWWLLRQRRGGADVRVMFHEPYFYFSWTHPAGNALALVQRAMAAVLLRASSIAYMSTETWRRYLLPFGASRTALVVLPIPATVPDHADPERVRRWRARAARNETHVVIGHFGTFGEHVARELSSVIPAVLDAIPDARFLCIGRRSDSFAESLAAARPDLADRTDGTGALPPHEVSAALRACDLVVQPYPDGVTTRRTSVMAALVNEVAVVTSRGELTESVWAETKAVAFAPAGDASAMAAAGAWLIRNGRARTALIAAGRRAYEDHFSLERTIDALAATAEAGA
jgi:glycosyltransferase involved in cell wall biosynthesis